MRRRGDSIAPFHAMEVLKRARRREAEGGDVLHMELGEPVLGAPSPVVARAREWLARAAGGLGYTDALGLPSLRERIARHYADTYGTELKPERIAVTAGSSAAFVLGLLSAFGDGARIGLSEPGYPAYRNIVNALGMKPVGIPTEGATRFQPTRAHLDAAAPLDGLVVASPSNPTGAMLDRIALGGVVEWCRQRGTRLISDEVYHGITYGAPAVTVAGMTTEAIAVNSFSKYYGMTGWRLGWLVAPPDLVRPLERLAQNLFICAPSLAQHAAEAAFDCAEELDARVAEYARSRDLLLEALPRAGFERLAPSDGAFYVFADVGELADDSSAYCRRMLAETGVAVTPGIDFDPVRGRRFLRFSFAGSAETVASACRRLIDWNDGR